MPKKLESTSFLLLNLAMLFAHLDPVFLSHSSQSWQQLSRILELEFDIKGRFIYSLAKLVSIQKRKGKKKRKINQAETVHSSIFNSQSKSLCNPDHTCQIKREPSQLQKVIYCIRDQLASQLDLRLSQHTPQK